MIADFYHEPVMVKEVIELLLVSKTGVYVDCTIGGAGHSYAILKETDAFLVGIDCDDEALQFAESRLVGFGSRKVLVKANFADLGKVLENLNIKKLTAFFWIWESLLVNWMPLEEVLVLVNRRRLICVWIAV